VENASKALIMAGSVLIGVLILTLFVYLFRTMGEYAAEAERNRAKTQINMFNTNFTKYLGETTYEVEDIEKKTCTIHDIVTAANFAKQTNQALGYEKEQDYSDRSDYVQIDFYGPGYKKIHLESVIEDEYKKILRNHELNYIPIYDAEGNLQEYQTRKYICEITFSAESGRVIYVRFDELK